MISDKIYTVATSAQLRGMNTPARKKATGLRSNEVVNAQENNRLTHVHTKSDFSKTVRSTLNSADRRTIADIDSGYHSVLESPGSKDVNLRDALEFQSAISFEALQEMSFTHEDDSDHDEHAESLVLHNRSVDDEGQIQPGRRYSPEHQHRSITKPEINIDATHLSRRSSPTSKFEQHTSDHNGTKEFKLYFTPFDVNHSTTWLSSPKPELDAELSQECMGSSFTTDQLPSPILIGIVDDVINLEPSQLDQLIRALARSPLLRKHIYRHWWDEVPDDFAVNSDISQVSTFSLMSASTLYSRPNMQFITRPFGTQDCQPESPVLAHLRNIQLPHPEDTTSIAIADPDIYGAPIRFLSRRFGAASIGACTFVDIPYSSNIETSLRLEPPHPNHSKPTIPTKAILQLKVRILDRKTGQRCHLLLVEIDLTPELRTAAIAELSIWVGKPMNNIHLPTLPGLHHPCSAQSSNSNPRADFQMSSHSVNGPSSQSSDPASTRSAAKAARIAPDAGSEHDTDSIDWIAVADALQHDAEVADAVDTAAARLAAITKVISPPTQPNRPPPPSPPPPQSRATEASRKNRAPCPIEAQHPRPDRAPTRPPFPTYARANDHGSSEKKKKKKKTKEGETAQQGFCAVTPETGALLARIDGLRRAYARCWVLRPAAERHRSGVPKSVGVPWVSGTIYAQLGTGFQDRDQGRDQRRGQGQGQGQRRGEQVKEHEEKKGKNQEKEEAEEEMRGQLVARVAKVGREQREFSDVIDGESVRFVPVFGRFERGMGEAAAWVCFLQGSN